MRWCRFKSHALHSGHSHTMTHGTLRSTKHCAHIPSPHNVTRNISFPQLQPSRCLWLPSSARLTGGGDGGEFSGLLALSQKTEIPRSKRNNFLLHFLRAGGGVQGAHLFRDCRMKTVLITGASGLLGRPLVKAFQTASWNVTGLAHSRASGDLLNVDLTDTLHTEKIVKERKPHVIVHSAAQRFPDKVEKDYDASYALNVTASKNLAALADSVGAAFIFISTDYVFDGRKPPYSEDAKPNPLNKYGKTKAEAEQAVLTVKPDAIVLRVPVLYGGEEYATESAVSVLCQLLNDRSKHVKASDYEIRYPSHTEDIAFIVVQLAERRLQDRSVSGVYQWCGLEPLTKYAMVRAIGQAHGLNTDHVAPDPEPSSGAPRPRDCRLEHTRLQQLDIARHTPFAQGVAGFAKFLQPAAPGGEQRA